MQPPPDASLIAALLDEHGAALTLYASRWTAEPEDCVQEALVELARQPQTPVSPVAWLCRVVKRRALNSARATRRRAEREQEALRRRLLVGPSETDSAAVAQLADVVAELSDDLAEVLVLRTWGGMTLAEVGVAIGVSTATASRRYQLALAELRRAWDDERRSEATPTRSVSG